MTTPFDVSREVLGHLRSGRPFYRDGFDVSVSHKNGLRLAIAVPAPYRIGIDIEDLSQSINTEMFANYLVSERENATFEKFLSDEALSNKEGLIAFWTMKEAFYKALDHPLFMDRLYIVGIQDKKIFFEFVEDIQNRLVIDEVKKVSASFLKNGDYFFAQVILEVEIN